MSSNGKRPVPQGGVGRVAIPLYDINANDIHAIAEAGGLNPVQVGNDILRMTILRLIADGIEARLSGAVTQMLDKAVAKDVASTEAQQHDAAKSAEEQVDKTPEEILAERRALAAVPPLTEPKTDA